MKETPVKETPKEAPVAEVKEEKPLSALEAIEKAVVLGGGCNQQAMDGAEDDELKLC